MTPAALAAALAARTPGLWFYDSYSAIFAAGLMVAAEEWPLDGEDVADPERYYHEAEPLVASVPALHGDSAHGRHQADARAIVVAVNLADPLWRVAEAARRVARPPAHEATHVGHHTALRAAIADLDAKVKEMP